MKNIWATKPSFMDFLEAEIKEGRNPNTPETWQAIFEKGCKEGHCTLMATADDSVTAKDVARNMASIGINVLAI